MPVETDTPASDGAGESANLGHHVTRRELLGYAAKGAVGIAALSGAGAIGYVWPRTTTKPRTIVKTLTRPRFRSRPDLDPMIVRVTRSGASLDSGLIFLTPSIVPGIRGVDETEAVKQGLGQEGVLIVDARGEVVWFDPVGEFATNLRVQTYRGSPVLTYWRGEINAGTGVGVGVILDSSYQQIASVQGGNGLKPDLHDFTLTPQGTALVTAYRTRTTDLSSVGGKKHGTVLESYFQEIDVSTGRVLMEWGSLDHVALTESYSKPSGTAPFDYFHINSVSLFDDQNILVSGRNTWAVYKINRQTGAVVWRLNGKQSDFKMGPKSTFAWQHHATHVQGSRISIFDDGATPQVESQSRALILNVDEAARTASLLHAYTHPALLLAPYEGSVQVMPNGNVFVGWGAEPYFSEFDTAGTMILDGRFPTNDQSYRAFRMPWTGTPTGHPAVATLKDSVGGTTVYVSWNGATEVATWQVLAGKSATSLQPVGAAPRSGFETAITIHTKEKLIAVVALDANGRRLGISNINRLT